MTDTPTSSAPADLRPSSLPKLAECRAYEGKPGTSPAAERGTRIDRIIRDVWSRAGTASELLAGLASEDADAVNWALDTMERLAEGADIETRESELAAACPVPGIRPGTMDALCVEKLFLIDFKTGQIRNYREQMAAYALACMDAFFSERWTAYLLFVDQQTVIAHEFTEDEARAIVEDVRDLPVVETPCDYCTWCARFGTCAAVRANVGEAIGTAEQLAPMKLANKAAGILPPDLDTIAEDDKLAWHFLACYSTLGDYVDVIKERVRARTKATQEAGGKSAYFTLTPRRGKRIFPARSFDDEIGRLGNMAVLSILGPASEKDAREVWEARIKDRPFPVDRVREVGAGDTLRRVPAKSLPKPQN